MPTNILDTDGGNDTSQLPKLILINPQGYALNLDGTSTGVRIVNTEGGTDLSAVNKIILTDLNGNSN